MMSRYQTTFSTAGTNPDFDRFRSDALLEYSTYVEVGDMQSLFLMQNLSTLLHRQSRAISFLSVLMPQDTFFGHVNAELGPTVPY